ncbi:hypothetical protein AB1K70_16840 [Bremerella sp. JC770]|uniref:hypothetical protein n=1 Tax=Bremerella sp. JC770 TaxID=3232137 RepID=UPI00345A8E8E
MAGAIPFVVTADAEYRAAATSCSFQDIPQTTDGVASVTGSELRSNYANRMRDKRTPGRAIYDQLRAEHISTTCPYCGLRRVKTLDHFLPQVDYPLLSVMPINLVPSCMICNGTKDTICPTAAEEVLLHPYYDDIDSQIWLIGEVLETNPVGITFRVSPPAGWPELLSQRVMNHFETFGIAELCSDNAANELGNLRVYFFDLFNALGEDAVRDHLKRILASYRDNRRNSWGSAMYAALLESDWFCSIGCTQI